MDIDLFDLSDDSIRQQLLDPSNQKRLIGLYQDRWRKQMTFETISVPNRELLVRLGIYSSPWTLQQAMTLFPRVRTVMDYVLGITDVSAPTLKQRVQCDESSDSRVFYCDDTRSIMIPSTGEGVLAESLVYTYVCHVQQERSLYRFFDCGHLYRAGHAGMLATQMAPLFMPNGTDHYLSMINYFGTTRQCKKAIIWSGALMRGEDVPEPDVYSLGVAFFALAEEGFGPEVYKEVLQK